MGRKNIKLPEPLFEDLKADKGPNRSWPQYFRDRLNDDADDAPDGLTYDDVKAACAAAVRAETPDRPR